MLNPEHILRSVFHLESFRPRQRDIVDDVLNGNDVVCVMPTGAGKSLCFQLPAVMTRGLTLIVSPLISLMADQVQHLRALNIPTMLLNSSQDWEQQRQVLHKLQDGFAGLLYIAPERFSAPSFQRLLPRLKPKLFVVDEAHCVSFWGHDFRPEYMKLAEARRALGSPVTMALTATATPQVRKDIVEMLGLRSPRVHVTGFDRTNLAYSCRHFERIADKDHALLRFLKSTKGSGIVYCSTRKAVEELGALFEEQFPERTVCAYHAGMDNASRKRSQDRFTRADLALVVATNAFGMGINKPDIRFVIHYNLPGSVEAYYQEAGRAGRDGRPAQCVLFYSNRDLRTQEFFIENIGENNKELSSSEVTRLQKHARLKLDRMLEYASRMRCRRRQILDYFGESTAITNCHCDVCANTAHHRYQPDPDREVIKLRLPDKSRTSRRGSTAQIPPASAAAPLDGPGDLRFSALKEVRLTIAKEHGWPAFCVVHDRVLREVAREAPKSIEDLAAVKGFGATKASKFGDAFLAAMRTVAPQTRANGGQAALNRPAANAPARGEIPIVVNSKTQASHDASRVAAQRSVIEVSPTPRQITPVAGDPNSVYERLKRVKQQIATQQNYPEFCILLDSTLLEIARLRPRSLAELAAVEGVGPRKAAKFGEAFLAALRQG